MTVFLLGCASASRWATTQARRSLIGLGQQIAATAAVLTLTSVTDRFAMYALPGVMLTAVFGYSVTRPPFVGSILLGVIYCLSFLAVAASSGLRSELSLQFLLRGNGGQCFGRSVLLERSQREAYAQSRLVISLHQRVDALLRTISLT